MPIAQIFLNALLLTMLYALVSSGLTLVLGIARIVNFAHGALYMLGGYLAYYVFQQAGLPFPVALMLAVLGVGLFGIFLDRLLFRRLTGQFFAAIIVSLGLVFFIEGGGALIFTERERSLSPFITGSADILSATLSYERIVVIAAGAIVMMGLFWFINRTRPGAAMRAVAQDSEAAALQGVNFNYTSVLAMGIGCGLAGFAGALLAPVFGVVNPYMGQAIMFKAILVITVGGFGSIPGAFIAALIIGFVESFGFWYIGHWISAILFAVVIVILLVRPRGILGMEYTMRH
jgi:branched-chain amino acid transport system permease protein